MENPSPSSANILKTKLALTNFINKLVTQSFFILILKAATSVFKQINFVPILIQDNCKLHQKH